MKKIGHVFRTHVGAAIAATSCAVVLVGGLLAFTFLGSGRSSTAATTTTTTVPARGKGSGGARNKALRGQITAMNGDTWTVTTTKGLTVSVEVTAATAFGTKGAPLSASDFSVGNAVVIVGARTTSNVVATRITKAATTATPRATTTTPTAA